MTVSIPFTKGHGAGNDFLVLHDPYNRTRITAADVSYLCDRRTGIGADGLLRAVLCTELPEAMHHVGSAEWFMDYRNADGSLGQMCGNGIRVLARHLTHYGHTPPGRLTLSTRAGLRTVETSDAGPAGDATVLMEIPRLLAPQDALAVSVDGGSWPALRVDVGNPHAVVFVDDLADAGPLKVAPSVSPPPPGGITIEFVQLLTPGHLALRVYERGVGETLACGTGACAAVAAAERSRHRASARRYRVDSPGGTLFVRVLPDGSHVLTGPAELTVHGILRPRAPMFGHQPAKPGLLLPGPHRS